MEYEDIVWHETDDHVGVIELNRPEAANSLTHRTYAELEHAVRTCEQRCLVITGTGSVFCAGDDVKQVMAGPEGPPAESLAREPQITPAAEALLTTDVPVIAAVNGPAVGWGMELALMADIRVAGESARFGELFVLRGLNCDVAGLGRLAGAVGREAAAELLFTGEVIDATRARELGLVSRVVPDDELRDVAMRLASRIAANPPLAVRRIKAGLREALDPDWASLGSWVSASLAELFRTEDHKEGVASFLEKREPQFKGR